MLQPQNTDERKDERYKEMERHTMFIDVVRLTVKDVNLPQIHL